MKKATRDQRLEKAQSLLLQRGPTFQRTKTELLDNSIAKAARTHGHNDSDKSKQGVTENQDLHEIQTDSSDEYDTDLEVEERELTPFDRYGIVTYKRTCRKLCISPISFVTRSLKRQSLDVSGRGLHSNDLLSLCRALVDNLAVCNVTLNDSGIGANEAEYISCVVDENINIKSLSLARNNIGHTGLEYITEVLLDNSYLTRLDISANHLQDAEAPLIASVLKTNTTLTYLNLSSNDLGDEAAQVLGPAIGINESLRVLDLSWNHIRPPGGINICAGVQDNVVLTVLNLAYNGLSVSGARAMAEALHENDVLTDLDLTCNRIFDEGVAEIGKALLVNETLRKLKLANNPVTTVSAVTLLTVLKKNEYSALEHLDMSSVHLYKDALILIKEIQQQQPSFDFLYGGVVNSDDQWGNLSRTTSFRRRKVQATFEC